MIPATEAARIINRHRDQAVVVSTSKALREWSQVSERRDLDVDLLDCLDKAADVALGISLARPELKVLVRLYIPVSIVLRLDCTQWRIEHYRVHASDGLHYSVSSPLRAATFCKASFTVTPGSL